MLWRVPEIDDAHASDEPACPLALLGFRVQAIQEAGFEPLVGVRADDPLCTQPGRFDQQAMTVAGLVRMGQSGSVFGEDGDDTGLAAEDFKSAIGRAVIQSDDAIHGMTHVMERAGQVPFFVPDGNQAKYVHPARPADPVPPSAIVEQHNPAGIGNLLPRGPP